MKKLKRMGALMLSVLLMCQTIVYFPAKAASSAEGSGTVALGSSAIAYSQKLTDNGDGTYTLALTVKDASYVEDVNTENSVSRNHYFTAPANGDYLIELWGGSGGTGSDNGDVPGGTGGAGGHVYGIVTLTKGETLYYQLGGNGSSTLKTGEGGGINGDGGAAGNMTSYSIGGGGGYSAIYKFDAGEFESAYLDGEGNMTVEDISEADRVSKFIAIAAGGGGGGAGSIGSSGIFGTGWLTDLGNPSNGGAGGSMDSLAVTVDGGTVYVGGDGVSSGTNTAYVGLGGADTPATYADTITTLFDTVQANDWYAVTNTDLAGGAGGSGNLRGGGGGAGYAGGGGGIQESILRAAHVGGGGGGSSYLADEVAAPTAAQIAAMDGKPEEGEKVGGAICITPVSGVVSEELQDVTLTITPSKYFTVDVTWPDGDETPSITDTAQTVEIKFTPIDGFAGGNNVPLLEGNAIPCVNGKGTSCSIPLKANCAAVNVPLNFVVDVVNHTTNVEGEKHSLDELHGTAYTDLDLNQTIYDFIDSVSGYTVDASGDDTYVEAENAVYPTETTYYPVSITVTPKTSGGYAVVGDPVKTKTFTKDASIIVLMSGTTTLNGNSIGYSKTLEYDENEGYYLLSLITNISSDSTQYAAGAETYSTAGTATFTAPVSGYYYIQAWGGAGGDGRDAILGASGGAGAYGNYTYGYVKLTVGQTLTITLGSAGNDGVRESSKNCAGQGGTATGISLSGGTDFFLVAGGGGGGGSGSWFSDNGGDALTKTEIDNTKSSNIGLAYLTTRISGNNGGFAGQYAANNTQDTRTAGTSAGGYYNNTVVNVDPTDASILAQLNAAITEKSFADSDNPNVGADGAVIITPVLLESEGSQNAIEAYTVSAQLSDYFDLVNLTDYKANVTMYDNKEKTEAFSDEDGVGVTVADGLITISDIDPKVTETTDSKTETDSNGNEVTTTKVTRTATFVIEIKLTPKDGFLGGNDVPILKENVENMKMSYAQVNDQSGEPEVRAIASDPATDYANVVISEVGDYVTLTTNDNTIVAGESVNRDDMYSYTSTLPTDWRDDFVTLTEQLTVKGDTTVITEDTLSPEQTTVYTVTLSLEPKADAKKAVVRPEISATTVPGEPIIYVLPQIHYLLTNITADDELNLGDYSNGYVTITSGVDHAATLTAAEGYKLPGSITVTAADGTDISSLVGYSSTTGKFTIPARYAVGTITVSAAAVEETYSITVYYPVGAGYGSKVIGPYKEGANISGVEGEFPAMAPMTGYTFIWDWGDFEYGPEAKMPDRDLTVIGTYEAIKYTLTVHHYKVDTTEQLAEDETFEVAYDSALTVTAKEIIGWLASVANATVTMDDVSGKEYTFYYTATSGQLNITYLYANGTQAAEKYTQAISTGQTYSVDSPVINGYTADRLTVSGTASGTDAENGINITVTYNPNTYTVTLDPNGGSVSTTSRPVEFGNIYGYDPEAGAWPGLPNPIRPGYDFEGWYLGAELVDGNTVVSTADDHTLTAQWKPKALTATVRYIYEDGTLIPAAELGIANPATVTGETGDEYSFTSPTLEGYTPDKTVVEGIFGTVSPTPVTVTYEKIKEYTLTVIAKSDDGLITHTSTTPVKAGETYTVKVKEDFDSYFDKNVYKRADGIDDTITGTMPASDKVIYIDYVTIGAAEVISVTVTWGALEFDYTYGAWQPTSHTYTEDTIEVTTNLSNTVTVSSDSNVVVNVDIAYASLTGFEGISGHFTEDANGYGASTEEWELRNGESKTVYLWLDGTLDRGKAESTYQCGTCTVTITGGG